MKITSPAFEDGERIPEEHTCEGSNASPPLEFSEVPKDTVSLCLIIEDPDAPRPNFTHWVLFNISPRTRRILRGQMINEAEIGVNDFGNVRYDGPCPPSGEHRYLFSLYALNSEIDLASGASKEEVLSKINDKIIDTAEIIGTYSRIT